MSDPNKAPRAEDGDGLATNGYPTPGVPDTPREGAPAAPTLGLALALVAATMAVLGRYLLAGLGLAWLAAAAFLIGVVAFIRLAAIRGTTDASATDAGAPERRDRKPSAGDRIRSYFRALGRCLDPRALPQAVRRNITHAPLTTACIVLSLVLSATVAALLHARTDARDISYWDVTGFWLLSIGLYLAAALQPQRLPSRPNVAAWLRNRRDVWVDAGALLCLALVLRLVGLGRLPDVIGGDEGLIGLTGRDLFLASNGNMFGTIYGYGTAYFHAVGLSVMKLGGGTGVAALRLPAALAGALAVPATYALGRQLFGRKVGLVAAALLATAHMHVHMSRVAYGQSIDTLIAATALFAFARGLERRDGAWMAVAGVSLGLAQYGYTGGRLIDLVIAAFVVILIVVNPARVRGAWSGIAVAFGAALVTAMPMVRWAYDRAPDYFDRVDKVGFLQTGQMATRMAETGRPAWAILAGQVTDAVRAVLVAPPVAFYGSRIAILDAVWGACFILGLGYAIWRLRDWRYLLLVLPMLGALAVLTLGGMVLQAGYRVLGVMPSMAVLAAFALVMLVQRGLDGLGWPERVPQWVLAGIVALVAAYNLNYYFGEFRRDCSYMDPRTAAASIGGQYIAAEAGDGTVFVLDSPGYDIAGHTAALYFTQRLTALVPSTVPEIPAPGTPGAQRYAYAVKPDGIDLTALVQSALPAVVLAGPELTDRIDNLALTLPGGARTTLTRCGKPVFAAYKVGAAVRP